MRHRKGDNKLYVYSSNSKDASTRYDTVINAVESTRTRSTSHSEPITLGGIYFSQDGGYDDYGKGIIHWCKVWYDDLGDDNARKLAAWTREPIRMEYYGANRYRLGGNTSQKCNASFICNHILADRYYWMKSTAVNAGGWDASLMRSFLNTRFYNALPTVWQSMLKKVKISATAGSLSTEVLVSEDYIYLPCITEMNNLSTSPYPNEGEYINWYTSNSRRAKFRGRIIPEDAVYYVTDSDPSTTSTNKVKAGDIWVHTGNESRCYMYIEQEEIDKFGITPDYPASIGGGWIAAYYYWLRSPVVSTTTNFWFVSFNGSCNYYGANNSYGVSPCFSI